ncbi:hypothetical protein [Mucilaginibacter myungsuensis]|uniref:Uncharacterized protein n=1 Tax=Mucilaginibacter myungsuensis TaxID=649104 RepID=A0A929PUT6_9SPHI|nr:hypothetical protein [Mucilaginibacter myungsuensis]MBE9660291.1 hypothetical protein [Mucilaginibacter myungsuensis]MDN3600333.1 hypothetical protein [Mucilaginibacter myungsuensis]
MFQRALTILLIFCIIGSGFSKLVVFAGFEMNQRYIATTLCENRDKPQLNCNGHCYFMKKVKQAEEKEKNNERQAQKELIQQVFFTGANRFMFSSTLLQAFPDSYRDMALQAVIYPILQPPKLSV